MIYYTSPYNFLTFIISILIALFAEIKVKHAFSKYSKISTKSGITGAECANIILSDKNIYNVSINQTYGYFSDYFDPRSSGVFLSEEVYGKNSIAAISVAAHECGHADQHDKGYFPIKIREFIIPICSLSSKLSMPLVMIGILFPAGSNFFLNLGILLFAVALLFQLITLPVEFNASRRALKSLSKNNVLTPDELKGAKSVLSAAALTYVAATFNSLLYLLRLIFISRSRDWNKSYFFLK